MEKFLNKRIFIIILSILTIGVIVFLYNLLGNMVIFDVDDLNSTYDSYPLWREENGRYVFNFLSRVFCLYIPKLFGVHIQNAVNTFCVFIYALILSFLFSATASFYFIKGKNIIIYALFYIIAGLVFLAYVLNHSPFYSVMATFQYGYVLAVACNMLFLFFVMSYILSNGEKYKEVNTKSKKYILLIILAFCAGNSTQIAAYTVFISMFLMSIVIFIKNRLKIKETKDILWNKVTRKPIIAYISGLILMVACPGFWVEVSWRHADSLQQIKDLFPEFIQGCYNHIYCWQFKDYYTVIYILLSIAIIVGLLAKRHFKDIVYELMIAIIPVIGVWCYFITLIFAGKTFPSEPPYFWFIEPFYHFYYQMLLCSVIILIVTICLSQIKNIIVKFLLLPVFIIAFLLSTGIYYIDGVKILCNIDVYNSYKERYNINQYISSYKTYTVELKNKRQLMYFQDKLILNSIYNNKDIVIADNISIDYIRYIKSAYKININKEFKYTDYNNALEYFKSNGGVITEEELEKTDFQKLFNKDFVLNKQKEKNEPNSNNTDI